jgi:hypothetical protein
MRQGCLTLAALLRLLHGLDDTDSDSLSHVAHGESTKWWVLHVCYGQ